MSDVSSPGIVAVPDSTKSSLATLEAQIAGLKAMVPGAIAAGMDTRQMEATITGLEATIAALRGIPGVG